MTEQKNGKTPGMVEYERRKLTEMMEYETDQREDGQRQEKYRNVRWSKTEETGNDGLWHESATVRKHQEKPEYERRRLRKLYTEMMDCEAKWKQDGTIRKRTKMKWPHSHKAAGRKDF